MGIFNLFKKKDKELTLEQKTNDTIKNASITTKVNPSSVAPEVFKLLWFSDGPYKNYTNSNKHINKFVYNGYTIEISFIGAEEPSAIKTSLPIKKPARLEDIAKPQYFPSYQSITVEQRWIFLNWLKNIDNQIDIGYVFLFYYGLERHLFFGDAESAFNMIIRLRQTRKNNSFLSYSSSALIAACMFQKRTDWFNIYLNSLSPDDLVVDNIYLLAKHVLGMDITAKELMNISKLVDFTNNRYLKDESILFEQELKKLLIDKYASESMPLSLFKLDKSPIVGQVIIANYSIDDKKRLFNIPSIISNQAFFDTAYDLLKNNHKNVKELLKELRKDGSYSKQVSKPAINKPTKEISDAFKASVLFKKIDTHIFDKNVEDYNKGLCPICNNILEKRPASKGKCSSCYNVILVKNSEFTGEKLILSEEEFNQMVNIRNERIYRNWVKTMLSYVGADIDSFTKFIKSKKLTIEDGLINCINKNMEKYIEESNMGIVRCNIMYLGNVYEKMNLKDKALITYLQVCYYDLRICPIGEDPKLAPAVVDWINHISKELDYSDEFLKEKYISAVKGIDSKITSSTIDYTFNEILSKSKLGEVYV
jgi:hypothetical protein